MGQQNSVEHACWIWYPGDWEIWLHERISVRRRTRGAIYPAMWRVDRHYSSVLYTYSYKLKHAEEVTIVADGEFAVYLDGQDNDRICSSRIVLPAGEHELRIAVVNMEAVPALYVNGMNVKSNGDWQVSCFDKRWVAVGSWGSELYDPLSPPSAFRLATKLLHPVCVESMGDGWFVDFGKETFGYLQLADIRGPSGVTIYYGESREEAEDRAQCVQLDRVTRELLEQGTYTFPEARAFRYVQIVPDTGSGSGSHLQIGSIAMLYEYLPVDYRGNFLSSNARLNEIWSTSLYTLHLNTREFFIDGIKRDRWVWSGDAYQSFLMNYYSFFDRETVKRTLIALRGKDPVTIHQNTILDYSLYWFSGIYDYYLYTGDAEFVKMLYPRMVSLMDFCLGRRNSEGMMAGLAEDWVFVDWADIDNRGEVSAVQLLLCRGLESIALVAELAEDSDRAAEYRQYSKKLKDDVIRVFWNDEKGGFVHSRHNGKLSDKVTKYPNIFAVMFGYLNDRQKDRVKQHVMLNPDIQRIKTPYMRFYELAALCEVREHQHVIDEILRYWGGMLDLGATSFWEEYDPLQSGREHLAMYGMPYGRSLCHAWGASPLYLLGRYYLGVHPLQPGYEAYAVEPKLGGLDWIEGTVPIGPGEVEVRMEAHYIRVRATYGRGVLRYWKDGRMEEATIPMNGSWLEVVL